MSLFDYCFVFSGYIPKIRIVGSYGSSVFILSRNFHTAFHSGCTSLHPHLQWRRVHFSPCFLQHLLFVYFSMRAIFTGMKWHVIAVLICVSVIISDVEYLFMWRLYIVCLLWRKKKVTSSAHFLIWLVVFSLWVVCIFWILIPCQLYHWHIFFPIS